MRLSLRSSGSASPRFSFHSRINAVLSGFMMTLASQPPINRRRSGFSATVGSSALGWSAQALAERSGVSLRTLIRLEKVDGVPPGRVSTLVEIQKTLEGAGIEFIGTPDDGPGLRMRSKTNVKS